MNGGEAEVSDYVCAIGMFGAVALGLVAVTGCNAYTAGAPRGEVDVIAHRGASSYAPENTLAAFELAIKMKAHWFELDCTLTKDGEVLVIHDDDLKRTTDSEGMVAQLSLAEARKADAGSWFGEAFASERLPTLGEALDLAKGRIGVYIEIKDSGNDGALEDRLLALAEGDAPLLPRHEARIFDLIEESGSRNRELTRKAIAKVRKRNMAPQVVIQSFSPVVCAVAIIEAPEIRTELVAESGDHDPKMWPRYLRWEKLLGTAGFNVEAGLATAELVERLHGKGKSVAVWTVNKPEDMARLANMGVDAIITNKPDVCLETLAETER
ncbi:MAG: glycerophosphodiester phosphodiesterase family protein [Candidatus Hydrogenedentes bacterium]|jgi:glycerophosphoryl diester phosphodiesterase|nr:glycerophosphodiester phosphodiesterase family protein [Candidatus Hydrogenedentota bacterium]